MSAATAVGALLEAIKVSGLFIPRGAVVQVKEPSEEVTPYEDEDPEMYWRSTNDCVVAIDSPRLRLKSLPGYQGLSPRHRGCDTTTHGKGTVQNVMDVTNPLSFLSVKIWAL